MPLPDDRQRVGHLPARSTGGTRHLLSVSGVGTILIITQDRLTLGPVSPRDAQQPAPDLALVTDPLTAPATICRDEEAYLLQHRDRTRLLTHGDRIDMGPRCSVKFRQPHPASATALLDLQAARVLDRPMRLVAMVQRELILGPGSQAHVVSRDVDGQIILVHRQGAWTLRSSDGRTHQPLEPGRAVHVRGVDLCLDPSTGNPSPESNVS